MLLPYYYWLPIFTYAQNIAVKGRLTNDAGEAVADASITVKGSNTGVKTNSDGYFEINAPAKAVLIISSVGYSSREVSISGRNAVNVTLTRTISNLDQVVVIGYGSQRKRDVTGSTISLKGEILNEIKAPNILNQLQGRGRRR